MDKQLLQVQFFIDRSDDTLFAKIAGVVKYERIGKNKKQVSVYEVK